MAVLTTEEAVSRVTAPPLRAAVERILQHYLASLGYADDAAGEASGISVSDCQPALAPNSRFGTCVAGSIAGP